MTRAALIDVGGVLIGPSSTGISEIFHELVKTRIDPAVAFGSFARADRAAHDAGICMSDGNAWSDCWADALKVDPQVARRTHSLVSSSPELTNRIWCEVNPDAYGCLGRLQQGGIRIGLVSQSDGFVHSRLLAAGLLDRADVVVDSGLVPWDKPNPGIYRYAADRVGFRLDECAFLSDVMLDVQGASRAGCADVTIFDPLDVWRDTDVHRVSSLNAFVDSCFRSRG